MAHRFLTVLLAVVLIGVGFAWPDRALASVANVEVVAGGSDTPAVQACEREDCLDDAVAASFADAMQDIVALPEAACSVPGCAMTMAPPRALVSLARRPPFLEAPQRPPCAA